MTEELGRSEGLRCIILLSVMARAGMVQEGCRWGALAGQKCCKLAASSAANGLKQSCFAIRDLASCMAVLSGSAAPAKVSPIT